MTASAIAQHPSSARNWIESVEAAVFVVERWLCTAALVVMLVAVAFSVAVRYFNLGIPNVGEWAIVAMSPLTFVGAAMCTYLQAHIAVDVVKLVRSAKVQIAVRAVVTLTLLVFSGVYAWLGYSFFIDTVESGEAMLDMGTPVAVPVFFLLMGMVLMFVHAAGELWRILTGRPPITEESVA